MAGKSVAAKCEHAYRIGSRDALVGKPALDVHDDSGLVLGIGGSAELMTELGETSATTSGNWYARLRMCERYLDGYHDASAALGAHDGHVSCTPEGCVIR
jgi:hypothetical protein